MNSPTPPGLVFLTGDFCSGSTLLFTLFRHAHERYYCFYEPLHEQLTQWLAWPLRPYENHFGVTDYVAEYRGLKEITRLVEPAWGNSRLAAGTEDEDADLHRYLSYLIGCGYGRSPRVALKENRVTFRMGWLRARFPTAKVIHVHRDRDEQWRSLVRRVQAHVGRCDVGQNSPDFAGFNLAAWCDDLTPRYPELARENFADGYGRFSTLWNLSKQENQRHADVSVDFAALTGDFDATWERIADVAGLATPASALRHLVVAPASKTARSRSVSSTRRLIDRGGRRYAQWRVASLSR